MTKLPHVLHVRVTVGNVLVYKENYVVCQTLDYCYLSTKSNHNLCISLANFIFYELKKRNSVQRIKQAVFFFDDAHKLFRKK